MEVYQQGNLWFNDITYGLELNYKPFIHIKSIEGILYKKANNRRYRYRLVGIFTASRGSITRYKTVLKSYVLVINFIFYSKGIFTNNNKDVKLFVYGAKVIHKT